LQIPVLKANDHPATIVWSCDNAIGRPRKKKIISRTRACHDVFRKQENIHGARSFRRAPAKTERAMNVKLVTRRTASREKGFSVSVL